MLKLICKCNLSSCVFILPNNLMKNTTESFERYLFDRVNGHEKWKMRFSRASVVDYGAVPADSNLV